MYGYCIVQVDQVHVFVEMTGNVDRLASGDPPVPAVFAPAPGVPVVPAIPPLHLAAFAVPFTSPFCPVCVVFRLIRPTTNSHSMFGFYLLFVTRL